MAFAVDFETLYAAANNVRGSKTEVEGHLGALRGQISKLGASWTGDAAGQFNLLMERWDKDATKLTNALGDIADLLQQSGTSHQVNDEEQKAMFNKFNILNEV